MADSLFVAVLYLVLINLISLMIFGMDKKKAEKGLFRFSERFLLALAFFGGALGIWTGMHLYRHKTKKAKFYIGIPLVLLLQSLVAVLWWMY